MGRFYRHPNERALATELDTAKREFFALVEEWVDRVNAFHVSSEDVWHDVDENLSIGFCRRGPFHTVFVKAGIDCPEKMLFTMPLSEMVPLMKHLPALKSAIVAEAKGYLELIKPLINSMRSNMGMGVDDEEAHEIEGAETSKAETILGRRRRGN